jgi:hypothetical protein
MSRIRANQITNQSADGAPTVQNGLVISGVTTSTTFSGSGASLTNIPSAQLTGALPAIDGSNLTNITTTTINNNSDNRIITGSGTANTLEGESNFTFDGNTATITASSGYALMANGASTGIGLGSNGVLVFGNQNIAAYGPGVFDATQYQFKTSGTERLRITSEGYIKIGGHSANRDVGGLSAQMVHLEGTSGAASISLINNQNSGGNSALYLGKSRGTSIGSNVILQEDDPMGSIVWCGSDGNDMISQGAVITAQVDGTPGSNDMPGRLVFKTTADGAATPTERLRITSGGHVLFSGLTAHNDPRNTNGITLKSTAGVSFQNYGANGSRNWRIRPDDQSRWGDLDFSVSPTANSATDWPDAAADKVLTLGYDGQVSKPRQASFAAMKSGNAYSLNNQVFPFDTTTHNVGNHFNTSNYRFTAPVAGRYLFTFYSILNSSGQGRYEILINGAADQNGTRVHMTPTTTDWDHVSTSWILNLAANDYIQMNSVTNTGWHGGHWQRFCGELLS